MLPTSVLVGGTAFLLVRHFTDLTLLQVVAVAMIAAFLADVGIAAAMQEIAPSWVNIGPGEKVLKSDRPSEQATIVAGFGYSREGQVSVRGETWRAVRAPDESGAISTGMVVSIVDRHGLTLVVSDGSG